LRGNACERLTVAGHAIALLITNSGYEHLSGHERAQMSNRQGADALSGRQVPVNLFVLRALPPPSHPWRSLGLTSMMGSSRARERSPG